MSDFIEPWSKEQSGDETVNQPEQKVKAFYLGQLSDAVKIQIVNFFLTLITFGIYRFWAVTRIRKHFWSQVQLEDSRFVYTGTGGELFKGLILVMIIMIPFFIFTQFVLNAALATGSWLIIVGSNLLYLAVIQVLIYLALFFRRRYILSRTTWRGVRFRLTGSAFDYALFGAKQLFLMLVTLGIYTPIALMKLDSRFWAQSYLGDKAISSEGSTEGLLKPYLIFYGVSLLTLVIFLGGFWELTEWESPYADGPSHGWAFDFSLALIALALVLTIPFGLYARYQAKHLNNLFSGLSIEGMRLKLDLEASDLRAPYAWIYFAFAIPLIMGALFVATYSLALIVIFYIALIIYLAIFLDVGFVNAYLRVVVENLHFEGHVSALEVGQADQDQISRGEGLAGALDVGGL